MVGVCFFGAEVRKMLSTMLGERVKVVFQAMEGEEDGYKWGQLWDYFILFQKC